MIRGRINRETVTPLPITEPRLLARLCRLRAHQAGGCRRYTGRAADISCNVSQRLEGSHRNRRRSAAATDAGDIGVCLFDLRVELKGNKMRLPPTRACLSQSQWLISSVTRAMPLNPRASAPAGVRSIIRPRTNGPRSFTLTTTDLPLRTFVTRTFVPKGRVRCAAVKTPDLTLSPFAVFGPLLAV